jgi:EF-hand domain pair
VDDVFKIFDKDGSKTIDKDEAVKHWSKNFGKISANEFFNTVDYNHDGQIQYDEFLDFWKIVKGAGHSEDEIQEEVSHSPRSHERTRNRGGKQLRFPRSMPPFSGREGSSTGASLRKA